VEYNEVFLQIESILIIESSYVNPATETFAFSGSERVNTE